ncbi:MAG: hypothetical protein H6722_09745 [Sandaracinus sp.]|nr:hypothetical protein [Sandaracinus sp.]MCB9612720.1 hypothetical protein [Sandaracinus sp.]MCB9620180.1 hypothetical protein [Sandaracinus sp.]
MRELRLALGLLGVAACVGYDAGIELAVELRIAPPTQAVPMGDGFATLSEARLRVADVELVPCELVSLGGGFDAPLVETLSFVRSRAHAHATAPSGDAWMLDARHDAGVKVGPTLRPAPGRYCAMRVHLEPTDDAPSFALVGEVEGVPFEVFVDAPLDVEVPMERTLEAPEDGGTITLDVDPACWLAHGVPEGEAIADVLAGCL